MKTIIKYLIKGIMAILAALPLKVHYALSNVLAWLISDVIGYRRDDVMTNLARSFPDMKYPELTRTRKAFYKHFADIIVETIWFGGCRNPKRLRRQRIVEIANPEEVRRVGEIAPSVVVLFSHCGNWELLGGFENYNYTDTPSVYGADSLGIAYRRMKSKIWDDIMRDNRLAPLGGKEFNGYLESSEVLRYAINHRSDKMFYHLNSDQRPYFGGDYPKVNFLHRKVETMTGGASLAHKYHMAVMYMRMPIVSRGHYKVEYVTICEDASKMSIEDITKKFYELVEADIYAQPYNYLWTHRRSYTNFQ